MSKPIEINEIPDLRENSILVIPGVGNINDLYEEINRYQPISELRMELKRRQIKVLGICLGFQFLCQKSDEYERAECLDFFHCTVESIYEPSRPSVGWKKLLRMSKTQLISPLDTFLTGKSFYFTHSFGVKYSTAKISSSENYTYAADQSDDIVAAMITSDAVGFQFHPEKSGKDGINLISASIKYLLEEQ